MYDIPEFKTKKELFSWLKEKEDDLIYQKKSSFKKADAFSSLPTLLTEPPIFATKDSTTPTTSKEGEVKVRAIINTTMVRDSHKDVHINGLWNKSLKENNRIKHIQEHEMKFDKIIADKDDLKAFTKTYKWRDLGYDVDGETEALVFDSTVKEKRNSYMYKQYKDENVDNHSVGMFYVTIKMALDSEEEGDEKYKAEFDKHIEKIANKEEVKTDGYFFAVYEAKAIEGSAVPIGSNTITPTVSTSKSETEKAEELKIKAIKSWLTKEPM